MATYTALLLRTDSTWQRVEMPRNYKDFPQPRDCIGGWITTVPEFARLLPSENSNPNSHIFAFCDEDGLPKKSPMNPFYNALYSHAHSSKLPHLQYLQYFIVGNILVCGSKYNDDERGIENDSITEQEIQSLLDIVKLTRSVTERVDKITPMK